MGWSPLFENLQPDSRVREARGNLDFTGLGGPSSTQLKLLHPASASLSYSGSPTSCSTRYAIREHNPRGCLDQSSRKLLKRAKANSSGGISYDVQGVKRDCLLSFAECRAFVLPEYAVYRGRRVYRHWCSPPRSSPAGPLCCV
jgi:hypothetical protein